jgi:aquaporin Z
MNEQRDPLPWELFVSEMIGTGLLLLTGLSLVILVFGDGSPVGEWIPSLSVQRALTGFVFGCCGAGIALSQVGKVSGAHINPAVTFGFLLLGKFRLRMAVGYVIAQLTGAALGALPLLLWGAMGRSISFGATLPGQGYSTAAVVIGEAVTTFGLVAGLCVFLGIRRLRPFTPAMIPFLYAIMVPLEASISGTSTNPARSFGPALVSGQWRGWWIYWVGPMSGTIAGVVACSVLASRIEVAKIYHFESDHRGVFHRMAQRVQARGDARARRAFEMESLPDPRGGPAPRTPGS